jgi:hypothetical protein
MSKYAADTASTTKKFLAAGGLAFGVASLGLFAGVGTAVADGTLPDTGSNDGQIENRDTGVDSNLAQEACWGALSSNPAPEVVGHPGSDGCEYSRLASSYGPHGSTSSSWPGGPTFTGYGPMHG